MFLFSTYKFFVDKCLASFVYPLYLLKFQLHFIFRHRNPKNGSFEEKHCKKPKERLNDAFEDKKPHLYTLVVQPDNTYQIKIDHKVSELLAVLYDCLHSLFETKTGDKSGEYFSHQLIYRNRLACHPHVFQKWTNNFNVSCNRFLILILIKSK